MYIGKIKVSHKKVPDTLIDEALGKFQQYEVEKVKAAQMRRNSLLSTQTVRFIKNINKNNYAIDFLFISYIF